MSLSLCTLDKFLEAVRRANDGHIPLNADQLAALRHDYTTPLWIIAGPGTGKTHTLIWLVLKRILVDGIPPERIILTTFTRKAAAELESRLLLNQKNLIKKGHIRAASNFDVTQLYVGTLHSLCSRILQDERYEPTLRVRLLEDDLSQQFFLRRLRNPLLGQDDAHFWGHFGMAREDAPFAPNAAQRATHTAVLFNRMTENRVDLAALRATGDADLIALADGYEKYQAQLAQHLRTDQAHLQRHFLNFLDTPAGRAWLGEGFTVVVDEYQDTNPIQEEIYFKLVEHCRDLTVVGDDDQSLYRFRGATVESLIDFDRVCKAYLGKAPKALYLHENRRSHPAIVHWVNRFIEHHPDMHDGKVSVRAPRKPSLTPASDITGRYPVIMAIAERDAPRTAPKVARIIRELKEDGLIEDYSQIAILASSTRETSQCIGTYTRILRDSEIPIYNPRNRAAHKELRFRELLGALTYLLDPQGTYEDMHLPRGVPDYVDKARDAYTKLTADGSFRGLESYVHRSINAIRHARFDPTKRDNYLVRHGGRRVTTSGLLYKLLGHEPFATDLTHSDVAERLKMLNLVLSDYESLYSDGMLRLAQFPSGESSIHSWTLHNFYSVFVEGVHDGVNDPEDEEISIQEGMVNVMTIHQAKGLEFEVVFVLRPDQNTRPGATHVLEDVLDPFARRRVKPRRRSREQRAAEDCVRMYFVAYSRARRLLILTGTGIELWDRALGRAKDGSHLNSVAGLEAQGVRFL